MARRIKSGLMLVGSLRESEEGNRARLRIVLGAAGADGVAGPSAENQGLKSPLYATGRLRKSLPLCNVSRQTEPANRFIQQHKWTLDRRSGYLIVNNGCCVVCSGLSWGIGGGVEAGFFRKAPSSRARQ